MNALENASYSGDNYTCAPIFMGYDKRAQRGHLQRKTILAVEKLRRLLRGPDSNIAMCWIRDTFSQLHNLDVTPCDEALPNTKKWLFKAAELAPSK